MPKKAKRPTPKKKKPPASRGPERKRNGRKNATKPKTTIPLGVSKPNPLPTRLRFDWDFFMRSENGVAFQRMVEDLLLEELGLGAFIPGPTHTGKDGSVDSWFDGKISGTTASWKIACAIRQDLKKFEKKATDECKKTALKGADAILIATPLDLNVPDVRALEGKLGKGLKKCLVYSRSRLEVLLRKWPAVAAVHFGHQFVPGLIALRLQVELDITDQVDLALAGRKDEVQQIGHFLSGKERVLLLVGPGGSGKSRLLRELPTIIAAGAVRRSAWLRRVGRGTLEESLRSGLPRHRPLLLCLDDSGRDPDEALDLCRLAMDTFAGLDVKVVLACRRADQVLVAQVCRSAKASFQTVAFGDMAFEASKTIVLSECPALSEDGVRKLVRFAGGNLFVLRAGARLIAEGTAPTGMVDLDGLRGIIVDRLVAEAKNLLATVMPAAEAPTILLAAALDAPLPLDATKANRALSTLLHGDMLRTVGKSVRFRADVEGDLILAHLSQEPWAMAYLEQALRVAPELVQRRLRNLAAAGGGHPAALVRQVCKAWLQQSHSATAGARSAILETLVFCVGPAPDETIALVERYAATVPATPLDPIEEAFGPRRLTTDEFSPIVLALARHGRARDALRLARQIAERAIPDGMYSNYKLPGLGADLLNGARQSAQADQLFDELQAWLADGGDNHLKARFLKSILEAALDTAASWTTQEGATTTFHEGDLPPTPVVLVVRQRAVALVADMISHSDPTIRLAGVEVFNGLGWGRVGMASGAPLASVVEQEVAGMLPLIAKRLASEETLAVVDMLESGLYKRWAAEIAGSSESGRIIAVRGAPALLRAYQLAHRGWEWRLSYDDLVASAPTTDRWSWWVHRNAHVGPDAAEVGQLVDTLVTEIREVDALLQAMRAMGRARTIFTLLDPWCAHAQPLFAQAAARGGLDPALQELLDEALERYALRSDPASVVKAVESALSAGSPESIYRVLLDAGPLSQDLSQEVAGMLARHEKIPIRTLALQWFRSLESIPVRLQLLRDALRDGPWQGGWVEVWTMLHSADLQAAIAGDAPLLALIFARLTESLSAPSGVAGRDWYLFASINEVTRKLPEKRLQLMGDVISDVNISFIGGLGTPLLEEEQGIRMLLDACATWVAAGRIAGPRGVAELLKAAVRDTEFPVAAVMVGQTLLGDSDQTRRGVGLALLSECRSSPEACVTVAEVAATSSDPLRVEAERLVDSFANPRGVISGAIGKAPEALVEIQEVLATAASLSKVAAARTIILRLQENVARDIESWCEGHEEILDPHHS